ncbi:MAG: hypothetical protein JWQ19_1361 [Subtercola sp.]|nr:hypothetical protein [Subtercola sp.]
MTLYSRALRITLVSGLAVGLTAAALAAGAASASADTDKWGNQILTPIADHPQDTGTVRINYGVEFAGHTIDVTVSDPADIEYPALQSADVGSDGSVQITNFAGRAEVRIELYSAPSAQLGPGAPLTNPWVDIYRGQTVTYDYNAETSSYTLEGAAPAPLIPATAAEAASLIPVTNSTVSPASWTPGQDVTLSFTRVTPNGVGDYNEFAETVFNYVYSSPTSLGSTDIVASSYSFTVPGAYTSGGHTAASFDRFGRLVSIVPLGAAPATTAPVTTTTATAVPASAALANTGQNDVLPLGIAVFALLALGATVTFVARKAARA